MNHTPYAAEEVKVFGLFLANLFIIQETELFHCHLSLSKGIPV